MSDIVDRAQKELVTRAQKAEIERLKAELRLERQRLATSEELRTGLVGVLHSMEAEIERLREWQSVCLGTETIEVENLKAEIERVRLCQNSLRVTE